MHTLFLNTQCCCTFNRLQCSVTTNRPRTNQHRPWKLKNFVWLAFIIFYYICFIARVLPNPQSHWGMPVSTFHIKYGKCAYMIFFKFYEYMCAGNTLKEICLSANDALCVCVFFFPCRNGISFFFWPVQKEPLFIGWVSLLVWFLKVKGKLISFLN